MGLAALALLCPFAAADDALVAQNRARAMLTLAKAQRDRHDHGCMTDIAQATARARAEGRPLCVWIGGCEKHTPLRQALAECVHCHVASFNGSAVPRLVVPYPESPTGWAAYLRDTLGQVTADDVRQTIHARPSPPPPPLPLPQPR
jgi:hypothetical protein